jgi:hypothetical protein
MPTIGTGSIRSQQGGVVSFTQPATAATALASFTLLTPVSGLNLFESYTNSNGNVSLQLRSLSTGPGLSVTANQGVIYISLDSAFSASYASIDNTGVVPYNFLPAEVRDFPIAFVIPGKPPVQQVYNVVLPIACIIPTNLAGTVVYDGTQPTGNAVFTLSKITSGVTTTIGTVTIIPGSNTSCTLSRQLSVTFMIGDVLQLAAPTTQDANLSDIGITILAMKQ